MTPPAEAPRETRTHDLKTWPTFFEAVRDGSKPFEVRENDRDFGVGDVLHLREYQPGPGVFGHGGYYTGRELARRVTYVLPGGRFGIPENVCILALGDCDDDAR